MEHIFRPKFFTLLKRGFNRERLFSDILAGTVVGIVALPLSIAFAIAAGVGPERGMITAVIAGFIIALLGGSRVQIGGPTGAFIVIIYGILQQYGPDGLFIATVMAGMLLILFGVLKLGTLLRYFPHPLIVGFTSGIAVVIFSTQIRDALGLDIAAVPSGFTEKWLIYGQTLHTLNPYAAGITLLTILIMIYSRKWLPRIPGAFIAVVLITPAVRMLHLPVSTIETFFGTIQTSVHLQIPSFNLADLKMLFGPALTIALLGGIESLLSAVVADGMISGNHRSNTELIAQGIANVVTPFFGGIPATGAIARTAANVNNGGRTPVAGLVHSLVLLLIMLFFGSWAKLIPMSILAGILIIVSYNMSEWRSFAGIFRGQVFDVIILVSTFLLTVLVDLTVAIEVGVVLSALLFMKRMADMGDKHALEAVDSDVLDDYSRLPAGVGIYEISGPLFFGSAKRYTEVLKETGFANRVLIIRMRHVPFVDSTGLNNFREVIRTLKSSGICVILSGVNREVLTDLKRSGILNMIPENRIFTSFDQAVTCAYKRNSELSEREIRGRTHTDGHGPTRTDTD